MKKFPLIFLVGSLSVALIAGCGDSNNSSQSSTTSVAATTTSIATTSAQSTRVLLGGLLLAVGDIDEAVANGFVTPEEAELAVAAIENGTMAAYVPMNSD